MVSDVSAWVQHIPFAFAATQMLQPRIIVELGTHKGDSYCAFCQAVQTLDIDARCFAIDAWTGDSHSGYYSQTVLEDLRSHHDPIYGSFSTLLPMAFDAALAHFADESIDLLHIDGKHTYEAVFHDFSSWRPKLSRRAVVLFHDISEFGDDFGVHRFWAQLSEQFPAFSFTHGSGLGVLCVGPEIAPDIAEFISTARESPHPMRDLFATLGHRLEIARAFHRIIAQVGFQHGQFMQWRATLEAYPRLHFPSDTSLTDILNPSRPDLKIWMDQLVAGTLENTEDLDALLKDDGTVRKILHDMNHATSLNKSSGGGS